MVVRYANEFCRSIRQRGYLSEAHLRIIAIATTTRAENLMKTTTNWAGVLAHLMSEHKETQYSLERKSGVPQPTIQRILRGTTLDPGVGTLKKLANAMGEDLGVFGAGVGGYVLMKDLRDAGCEEMAAYQQAAAAVRAGRISPARLLAVIRALTAEDLTAA
jgi:transcriptional regulator with XRE-family HTH domain